MLEDKVNLPAPVLDLIVKAVDQNVDPHRRNVYRTRLVDIIRAAQAAVNLYDKQFQIHKNKRRVKVEEEE